MKHILIIILIAPLLLSACSTPAPIEIIEPCPQGLDTEQGACSFPTLMSRTVWTQQGEIELTLLATDLEHPWAIAFLPDKSMLITERTGNMRIIHAFGMTDPLEGMIEVASIGQGGLLDIALHPSFSENAYVYFTHSVAQEGGYTTRLSRATLIDDRIENVETLFTALPASASSIHFGSRIAFDDENRIYMSIGDRGEMERAQDLTDHAGKIIRLNDDGSIPHDNPFIDNPDALDEIYAYGVRNPQGMIWRTDRQELWINSHGPQGGDELLIIRAGANHGWPLHTYGEAYGGGRIGSQERPSGLQDPLHVWTPSIAPSGMSHYSSIVLEPWTGDLFIGALAGTHIARLVLDEDATVVHEETLLRNEIGRIRDVRIGPNGYIYAITDARNGSVYRIGPFV